MTEILVKLKNYWSLVMDRQDSSEAMRNDYVVEISHITKDNMEKEFSMRPEYEVIFMKAQDTIKIKFFSWQKISSLRFYHLRMY